MPRGGECLKKKIRWLLIDIIRKNKKFVRYVQSIAGLVEFSVSKIIN